MTKQTEFWLLNIGLFIIGIIIFKVISESWKEFWLWMVGMVIMLIICYWIYYPAGQVPELR